MAGVVIAQLFRLQHAAAPDPRIGYAALGVPLAASFIALGMLVLLLGACRFWRLQAALVRGKTWAGGWEILAMYVSYRTLFPPVTQSRLFCRHFFFWTSEMFAFLVTDLSTRFPSFWSISLTLVTPAILAWG